MVRPTCAVAAQIGRLATPAADAIGGELGGKAKDFYREAEPALTILLLSLLNLMWA